MRLRDIAKRVKHKSLSRLKEIEDNDIESNKEVIDSIDPTSNTQTIIDWVVDMTQEHGPVVFDNETNMDMDWTSALMRKVFGVNFKSNPEFLKIDDLRDFPNYVVDAANEWKDGIEPKWASYDVEEDVVSHDFGGTGFRKNVKNMDLGKRENTATYSIAELLKEKIYNNPDANNVGDYMRDLCDTFDCIDDDLIEKFELIYRYTPLEYAKILTDLRSSDKVKNIKN